MPSTPWIKADQRLVPCKPLANPLWQGMIPLQRTAADPSDDRVQSVVSWVEHLLHDAANHRLSCPDCGRAGSLIETLTHLLTHHDATPGEAAGWLEAIDADLYALAVHYLAAKQQAADSRHPAVQTDAG